MDHVCFALHLLPGKTEGARSFMRELDERYAEYAFSEQRIGITKESWYLQHTPRGDVLLAYLESPDLTCALKRFSESKDEFELWFKKRLAEATGVDLNDQPSSLMSERLSRYETQDGL